MKKIIFVLLIAALTSCGKSMEEKAADAKYLQDLKESISHTGEAIRSLQANNDFNNQLGAINSQIRKLEK